MDTTSKDFFFLFPLIYMIPTYVLYCMELFVMFINRKRTQFAGSFFHIWVTSAINNLLCSILYFLINKGTEAPALYGFYSLLPESGFFPTLFMFILYFSGAFQSIIDLVLCFNRFTVVLLGTKYRDFWHNYGKYFIFVPFLIPVLMTWQTWFYDVKLFPMDPSDHTQGYLWSPMNFTIISWAPLPIIITSNVIITATLSFLMNSYVCWYIIKQKKGEPRRGVVSNHDIKLFLYNLLVFFVQLVQLFLQVNFWFLNL